MRAFALAQQRQKKRVHRSTPDIFVAIYCCKEAGCSLKYFKIFSILIIEFEVPARQGPARRPLPVTGPGPTRF